MASLDSLSSADRAILKFVTGQEQSPQSATRLANMPMKQLRSEARSALLTLAPTIDLPPEIVPTLVDFLLEQLKESDVERAQSILRRNASAAEWAATVRVALNRLEQEPTQIAPVIKRRSARRSQTLSIVAIVCATVIAIAMMFVLMHPYRPSNVPPNPSPGVPPIAALQQVGTVHLTAQHGSHASGTMNLLQVQDKLAFSLEADHVIPNRSDDSYAIWVVDNRSARRLGFVEKPVGRDGRLSAAGPQPSELDHFPAVLARYKRVLVTRETEPDPHRPGRVVLAGMLPASEPE